MTEVDLNEWVIMEDPEDRPALDEYRASEAYQWALYGRTLTVTAGISSGIFGIGSIIEATSYAPNKAIAVGAGILSIFFAGAAYKSAKDTILGAFRSGYVNGHRAALNEAGDDVQEAIDAASTPSNN